MVERKAEQKEAIRSKMQSSTLKIIVFVVCLAIGIALPIFLMPVFKRDDNDKKLPTHTIEPTPSTQVSSSPHAGTSPARIYSSMALNTADPNDNDLEELVYYIIGDLSAIYGYHKLKQRNGKPDSLDILLFYQEDHSPAYKLQYNTKLIATLDSEYINFHIRSAISGQQLPCCSSSVMGNEEIMFMRIMYNEIEPLHRAVVVAHEYYHVIQVKFCIPENSKRNKIIKEQAKVKTNPSIQVGHIKDATKFLVLFAFFSLDKRLTIILIDIYFNLITHFYIIQLSNCAVEGQSGMVWLWEGAATALQYMWAEYYLQGSSHYRDFVFTQHDGVGWTLNMAQNKSYIFGAANENYEGTSMNYAAEMVAVLYLSKKTSLKTVLVDLIKGGACSSIFGMHSAASVNQAFVNLFKLWPSLQAFYDEFNSYIQTATDVTDLKPTTAELSAVFSNSHLCSDLCEYKNSTGVCDSDCKYGSDCSDCGPTLRPALPQLRPGCAHNQGQCI